MTTKYLDFDSTYRDRNLWPLPGEFEVLLAPMGGQAKTAMTASDPISNACPIIEWTSNRFEANVAVSPSVTGTVIAAGIGAANSKRIVVFETLPGDLQQKKNYYRHAVLRSNIATEYARITEYKYLGNNKAMVKLDADVLLMPLDTVTIVDPSDFIDPANALLFVPTAVGAENNFFKYLIYNETLSQHRPVASFDGELAVLKIGGAPVPLWLPSHNYSLRKDSPILTTIAGVGSTASEVVLSGGSSQDGAYVGSYIRILAAAYNNTLVPPETEMRRIVSYDGDTGVATVFPAFSASTLGASVEVLQFSSDNSNPYVYLGTQEKEPLVFAIKLNRLVLPNQILSVGIGGQIAFYPYVYVELTPSEIPVNYAIYSNNPNTTKMLFRASIDDIQNLEESTFISLDGDDMEQTLRFKAESNYRVRVILPNGETFNTMITDTKAPCPPNPLAQLSMIFQLKRL